MKLVHVKFSKPRDKQGETNIGKRVAIAIFNPEQYICRIIYSIPSTLKETVVFTKSEVN